MREAPKRGKGKITVRATWGDGLVMMFGTSYRTWDDQLSEYCRLMKRYSPSKIEVSDEPWIGFGGLKWCPWETFQEQLDHEDAGRTREMFTFRPPTKTELRKATA